MKGLPAPKTGGTATARGAALTGILAEVAFEGASILLAGEASSAEVLPVAAVAGGGMSQASSVLTPYLAQFDTLSCTINSYPYKEILSAKEIQCCSRCCCLQ